MISLHARGQLEIFLGLECISLVFLGFVFVGLKFVSLEFVSLKCVRRSPFEISQFGILVGLHFFMVSAVCMQKRKAMPKQAVETPTKYKKGSERRQRKKAAVPYPKVYYSYQYIINSSIIIAGSCTRNYVISAVTSTIVTFIPKYQNMMISTVPVVNTKVFILLL